MAGTDGERVTEGLDGLRDRLAEYRELGARFAKWRAVLDVGEGRPSARCVTANALARYAALCQEQGLLPIVEPEVLMDGAHGIERCEEVTGRVLQDAALATWRGSPDNVEAAQRAFQRRARCNGLAAMGAYAGEEDEPRWGAAAESGEAAPPA
jgi:fructose-bisphosphate aldolase class 1